MTTALQNLQGLLTAFLSSPAIQAEVSGLATSTSFGATTYTKAITGRLQDAINAYDAAVNSSNPPDLETWTANYQVAFVAADLAERWVTGASTGSTGSPVAPSPGTARSFDTTAGTYNALLSACTSAEALALSPTNGQPAMPDLAGLVANTVTALTAAWRGGPPTPSSELAASFTALIFEAAGLAGALGLAWEPST